MKKRIFAIMLALAMLLAAVPALAAEGEGGEALETAANTICKICGKEVASVDANGLCKDCAIKQVATRSIEASATATNEGGVAGGEGNGTGDNTGNTSDNPGENSNTDSTGNSGSTDGNTVNTGTNVGQNPSTSDGGESGEQPANPPPTTCDHTHVRYEQYATEAEGRYSNHKKVCMDCRIELVEPHQWDENTKKPKTEGTNIPTCTNGGDWTKKCRLCSHVTVFKGSALGHDYGEPTWNWCGVSSATATFKCTRCGESQTIPATVTTRNEYSNCYVYTRYTATVQFNGKTYTDPRTDYSCRPDWYYDPCYYNNPCGHWGCGSVCTRYSDCVPCRDYRTTFRVGGYNCLATPKTGDVSVIAPAMLALIGAAGAMLGKKRR